CLAPTYPPAPGQAQEEETRGALYHLPFARLEADSILHQVGSGRQIRGVIDQDSVLRIMERAAVFHYAGHAIGGSEREFLALSAGGDDRHRIETGEIRRMHLPAEMVVLSTCETGLGRLETGEGIRSLGRSFLEAGAASA